MYMQLCIEWPNRLAKLLANEKALPKKVILRAKLSALDGQTEKLALTCVQISSRTN